MNKSLVTAHILDYITRQCRLNQPPGSQQIHSYLEKVGHPLSKRQVQRYLRELQEQDRIDKHPKEKVYLIDKDHLENTLNAKEKLERSLAYESLLKEENNHHPLGHPIIAFEAQNNFKGAENIPLLLQAIRANRVLRFHYQNYYQQGADSERKVGPLFLKEYLNRWYLVAWDLDKNAERIFGIDRVSEIELAQDPFDPMPYYEKVWNYFEDVVGLRYGDGKDHYAPMELELRSKDINVPFLESLPLHHSQQKMVGPADSKDQTRFKLRVAPNFELLQRLLSMADLIEVESPLSYRRYFKEQVAAIYGQY